MQDNDTALMYGAMRGHTDVVQVLLSRQDVDINMRNKVENAIQYISLFSYMSIYDCL